MGYLQKARSLNEFIWAALASLILSAVAWACYLNTHELHTSHATNEATEATITIKHIDRGHRYGFFVLGTKSDTSQLLKFTALNKYTETTKKAFQPYINKEITIQHSDGFMISCHANGKQICTPKCENLSECDAKALSREKYFFRDASIALLAFSAICLLSHIANRKRP